MFTIIFKFFKRVLFSILRALFGGLYPRKDVRVSTSSVIRASNATDKSVTVVQSTLTATKTVASEGLLQYPVVIIHGFSDRPTISGIENVAETVLSELGIEHFTPVVQAFGSVFERSKSLVPQIAAKYPGKTVHLIAHSMGGLNARDIATSSMTTDLGFTIKTVTTLATPHRGIKAIDFVPELDATDAFATELRNIIGTDLESVGDMGFNAMVKYNREHKYNPNVKYFSWAGEMDIPSPIFAATYPITRAFGPTDGLINLESATWGPDLGPGTHLGTLHGADHASLVGRTSILGTLPHIRAAEVGKDAVLIAVDNTLVGAITRSVRGTIDSLLGPMRAILTGLGLYGVPQ